MKYLFTFSIISILMACSSTQNLPDRSWKNKRWVLTELNGNPVQISQTDKDAHIIFFPDEQRIAGSGGCNRLMGPYSIGKKNTISFTKTASTMMACPDMQFESAFLKALGAVNRYKSHSDYILLKDHDKVLIKLVPMGKP